RNPLFTGLATRDSLGDAPQSLRRYTVGGSATVAGDGRWIHTVLAGVDGYRLENVGGESGPVPLATQSALLAAGGGDRGTLRASSTLRLGDDEGGIGGTVALSMEHSVLRERSVTREPAAGPRQPEREPIELEDWRHATGVVAQTSGSWRNTLFATAGVRVERNDAFAVGSGYATLPMLGGAWVREVGGAEVKLRAAYGRGIRPPRTPARAHLRLDGAEPALELEPEAQSGVELGAELYAGRALSLQITRFDQRATGLIQDVAVGVDTVTRAGGGAPIRRVRYELQNVGAISNRGWEMQGTLARGPLAFSATMALVDSRVRTVAARYLGDLQPGDRVLAVPARTGSLAAEWSGGPWSAALTATRAWDWINYDRLALARDFAGRTRLPREMMGAALRGYWREYDGSTELRAAGTRQVTPRLALTVVADNLLGNQLDEPDNVTIRPGRSVTLGARATF
ncbi:MAG TPA: TonB-dependent receptor, partial [Longimicrobium sp.]|nr:TonB-dependent receptor [Longimicrobium sp.]